MRSSVHLVVDFMIVEFGQSCFGMCPLDGCHIVNVPEEEVVDSMGHIQCCDLPLHLQSRVDVLICMAANMKIAWNFFDRKVSLEPAAPFILKGFLRQLVLLLRTWLPQQLKIVAIVNLIPIAIESILFD